VFTVGSWKGTNGHFGGRQERRGATTLLMEEHALGPEEPKEIGLLLQGEGFVTRMINEVKLTLKNG